MEKMSFEFWAGGALWIVFIGLAVCIWFGFTKKETSWQMNLSLLITLALLWLWMLYIEDVLQFFGVFA